MSDKASDQSYSPQQPGYQQHTAVVRNRRLSIDMVVRPKHPRPVAPADILEPAESTNYQLPYTQPNELYTAAAYPKKLQPKAKQQRHSWQHITFTVAGICVFVFGIGVSIIGLRTNADVAAQVQQTNQQLSQNNDENAGDHPDETKPDLNALTNYQVAPELPRRISIAKLGVNARILQLGVKTNNELKAPSNIYDTGWYESSGKPGNNGAMLIDGHVSGPTSNGIFYRLKDLKQGDIIEIERGDHQVFRYQVVKTQVYDKNAVDMASLLASIEPNKQGLNLISCTGSFQKDSQTFSQRLAVYASRIE